MSRFVSSSRPSEAERARLLSWQPRVLALVRIIFGLLWAISAWFTCQPAAVSALQQSLIHAGRNPAVLTAPWNAFWFHIAVANPAGFALGIALLEGCIALGFLTGFLMILTCSMAIALALLSWSTAAPGLIAPAGLQTLAGDPGIALVCILACIGLSLYSQTARKQSTADTLTPSVSPQKPVYQMPVEMTRNVSRRKSSANTVRQRGHAVEREEFLPSRKRA